MNHAKFSEKVSLILQIISIFTVSTLFFGFLIVNAYLAAFGFWDFNFLKIQYFSAGSLFLFLMLLPAALFYMFLKAEKILDKYKMLDKSLFKTISIFIFKILVFSVISFFSFFLTFAFFLQGHITQWSFLKFICILWITLIFVLTSVIRKSYNEIKTLRNSDLNLQNIISYFGAHFRLLYVLFAIPVFLLIFSFFFYPTIPRYLGGGEPSAVSITYEKDLKTESEIPDHSYALLIYQSADLLLVKTIAGVYLLRQDDIAYIKYLDDNRLFNIIKFSVDPTSTTTEAVEI